MGENELQSWKARKQTTSILFSQTIDQTYKHTDMQTIRQMKAGLDEKEEENLAEPEEE